MWSVYPEATDWNVGAVHSDFDLGECIWRAQQPIKFGTFRKSHIISHSHNRVLNLLLFNYSVPNCAPEQLHLIMMDTDIVLVWICANKYKPILMLLFVAHGKLLDLFYMKTSESVSTMQPGQTSVEDWVPSSVGSVHRGQRQVKNLDVTGDR